MEASLPQIIELKFNQILEPHSLYYTESIMNLNDFHLLEPINQDRC